MKVVWLFATGSVVAVVTVYVAVCVQAALGELPKLYTTALKGIAMFFCWFSFAKYCIPCFDA